MNMPYRKRVLVTGGAGFLGRHLILRLLQDGNEVICLDNFSSSNNESLAGLGMHPRFSLLQQHVAEPIHLDRVDRIYNLACPASPLAYQADPVDTVQTSVLGMIRVLELAKSTGARVLQASSSEVYGQALEHPQSECYWGNVNPLGPRACYDEGKRCAEVLCAEYARQTGLVVKIARIFNTYGPGMLPGDGRVIPNFMIQALSGEPMTIYGNGSQTRSFCYVSDLVQGLLLLMESGVKTCIPVNLGNPQELSMLMLARLVCEVIGCEPLLVYKKLPVDDPVHRRPDIGRARRLLGWHPVVAPMDGLRRTAAYFGQWLENHAGRQQAALSNTPD